MPDLLRVTVADGKYTVTQHESGELTALRYGEEWRVITGDNLVLTLAQELDEILSTRTDPGVERVREFHEAFDCVINDAPWLPVLSEGDKQLLGHYAWELANMAKLLKQQAAEANGLGRTDLGLLLVRLQLQVEETGELAEAYVEGSLVKVLDALSDIGYVTDGTYLTHGLAAVKVEADERVHASNMSKLGVDGKPIIASSGRVVKGVNYQPPELGSLVE